MLRKIVKGLEQKPVINNELEQIIVANTELLPPIPGFWKSLGFHSTPLGVFKNLVIDQDSYNLAKVAGFLKKHPRSVFDFIRVVHRLTDILKKQGTPRDVKYLAKILIEIRKINAGKTNYISVVLDDEDDNEKAEPLEEKKTIVKKSNLLFDLLK